MTPYLLNHHLRKNYFCQCLYLLCNLVNKSSNTFFEIFFHHDCKCPIADEFYVHTYKIVGCTPYHSNFLNSYTNFSITQSTTHGSLCDTLLFSTYLHMVNCNLSTILFATHASYLFNEKPTPYKFVTKVLYQQIALMVQPYSKLHQGGVVLHLGKQVCTVSYNWVLDTTTMCIKIKKLR